MAPIGWQVLAGFIMPPLVRSLISLGVQSSI
jgi:hypothetical protein